MSCGNYEAFVYSWRNLTDNRIYIGWHKGSTDDGYICSSKVLLGEYKTDPSNFERYIISRGTRDQMLNLEAKLLAAVDAKNNPEYYNQHNGDGKFSLKHHSEESKIKIGNGNRGKKHPHLTERNKSDLNFGKTEESKKRLSEYARSRVGELNPNYGKKASPELRDKMSKNRKGKGTDPKPLDVKEKMSISRKLWWAKRKGEL